MTRSLEELSPGEKRELLARVLRRRAQEESRHPLSPNQMQLWLLDQVDPGNCRYTLLQGIRVEGEIDFEVGQRAVDEILRRHESLRTTFHADDGAPFQKVAPWAAVPLRVKDLRTMDRAARDAAVPPIIRQEIRTPFSLKDGPLLRILMLRLDDAEHIALIAMHHIIADGWSLGVFLREFGVLYEAFSHGRPSPLPELPIQLKDYITWRRRPGSTTDLEGLSAYWEEQLRGAPPGIDLTPGLVSSGLPGNEGAQLSLYLPEGLFEALKSFSARQGVTLFMTLFAGFLAVLSRRSGQEDLMAASPMADRDRPETQGLIAFMVESLLLRVRLSGNPTVRELLARVRDTVIGAQAHRDFPFDRLVQTMQRVRDPGYGPLTQVLFGYQNMPLPPLVYPGLRLTRLDIDTGVAPVDLWAQFIEKAEGFELLLIYKTALFSRAAMDRLAREIAGVLEAFVRDAELHLADLPCGEEGTGDFPGRPRARSERAYQAPQTAMEARLARLWAETLCMEKIGREDNFFALGGHSLLAIQVIHRMNEELGITLPFKALFECPTVRQLAARMEGEPGAGVAPLVSLQASTTATTNYCFHQAGGQIHSYRHLAGALRGACTVLGIQSRGVAEPAREHSTFAAMVEDYTGMLLLHQKTGPFVLTGYSTAGPIAAAVARKLEEAGRAVGLVALIDPVTLPEEGELLDTGLLPALVMSLRASFGEEMALLAPDDQRLLRELTAINSRLGLLPKEERMQQLTGWLEALPVPGEIREVLSRRLELARRHYDLLKSSAPAPIAAPMFLCLSTKPIAGVRVEASVWERCARGAAHRLDVEADHFAMMRPPFAAVIAEQLSRLLPAPSASAGALTS